jgi:hypothetical protein
MGIIKYVLLAMKKSQTKRFTTHEIVFGLTKILL